MALPVAGAQLPPDDSRGPQILACNWTLAGAATLIVASRLYSKCLVTRSVWWDDAAVSVGLIIAIVYSAGVTIQVRNGYGRHGGYLVPHDFAVLGLWNSITNCLNAAGLFFVRTSICLFLFRMVRGTAGTKAVFSNWPVWIALFLNTSVAIGTTVMFSIVCVPLRGLWDKSIHAFCVNLTTFNDIWRFFISVNCLVDFILAVVPCVRVYYLNFRGKLRLSINVLLTCGLVTAGMSIGKARFQFVNTSTDPTWDLVASSYFSALEMYLSMIFCSAPAVSRLVFRAREHGTSPPSSQKSLLPKFMQRSATGSSDPSTARSGSVSNAWTSRSRSDRFVPNFQAKTDSSIVEIDRRNHDGRDAPVTAYDTESGTP